ncbi:hypothetical protein GCM10022245_65550 [Streptomyces mayteni]
MSHPRVHCLRWPHESRERGRNFTALRSWEGFMRVALVYPEVLDLARFKEKRREFPPFGVLYLAA